MVRHAFAKCSCPVRNYGCETRSLIRITLLQDPFTEMATEAIPLLRENARTFSPQAMIGGPTAEVLDSENALSRDARLIIPLALALVFLIVAALLRSLVAPIYAVATVILSYAFALGVSAFIFPETDPAIEWAVMADPFGNEFCVIRDLEPPE